MKTKNTVGKKIVYIQCRIRTATPFLIFWPN